MTSTESLNTLHHIIRMMVLSNIKHNWQFIVDNAKKDVHCKGLHSIVIDKDENGMLKRIFFTDVNHEMWHNSVLWNGKAFPAELSVGIHSHHCDLSLIQVYGEARKITNLEFIPVNKAYPDGIAVNVFKYISDLVHKGHGLFKEIGKEKLCHTRHNPIDYNGVKMTANQLHTVHVQYGTEVAWLVVEEKYKGKKAISPKGEGKVYTNADLKDFNFGNYYHTIHESEIRDALKKFFGFPADVFP